MANPTDLLENIHLDMMAAPHGGQGYDFSGIDRSYASENVAAEDLFATMEGMDDPLLTELLRNSHVTLDLRTSVNAAPSHARDAGENKEHSCVDSGHWRDEMGPHDGHSACGLELDFVCEFDQQTTCGSSQLETSEFPLDMTTVDPPTLLAEFVQGTLPPHSFSIHSLVEKNLTEKCAGLENRSATHAPSSPIPSVALRRGTRGRPTGNEHIITDEWVPSTVKKKREPMIEHEELGDDMIDDADDDQTLYCVCRRPHERRFMVCCDGCGEWFHGACVKITKIMAKASPTWLCPLCKSRWPCVPSLLFFLSLFSHHQKT